jgi:hypothetical protein
LLLTVLPGRLLPVRLRLEPRSVLAALSPEPWTVSPLSAVVAEGGSAVAIGPGMSSRDRRRRDGRSGSSVELRQREMLLESRRGLSTEVLPREDVRLGIGCLEESERGL